MEDVSGAMRDISLVQDENLGDWFNDQACVDDKVVILPPFFFFFLKDYVHVINIFSSDMFRYVHHIFGVPDSLAIL